MGRGIFDWIGLAATFVFAIPIAAFGLTRLVAGESLMGVALLGIAIGMVIVEEHVTTPGDVPKEVASDAVGKVVEVPDEEE